MKILKNWLLHQIEFLTNIFSEGKETDLILKSAVEEMVVKWSIQINEILVQKPDMAFDGGKQPTPIAGLQHLSYCF